MEHPSSPPRCQLRVQLPLGRSQEQPAADPFFKSPIDALLKIVRVVKSRRDGIAVEDPPVESIDSLCAIHS